MVDNARIRSTPITSSGFQKGFGVKVYKGTSSPFGVLSRTHVYPRCEEYALECHTWYPTVDMLAPDLVSSAGHEEGTTYQNMNKPPQNRVS
jgi:hypothetical protein